MTQPVYPELSEFELMLAAIVDVIVDEIPLSAVWDLSEMAENADQFFEGIQATIHLRDLVQEYYE